MQYMLIHFDLSKLCILHLRSLQLILVISDSVKVFMVYYLVLLQHCASLRIMLAAHFHRAVKNYHDNVGQTV